MSELLEALRRYAPGACDPVERYLRPNAGTAFGKAHGFAEIRSYEDFAAAVPLQDDASLGPWVARAAAREPGVLTTEDPVGFELTSGTSSARKLVPVTPAYRRELAAALGVWMRGWRQRVPAVFDGPGYWSISPRLGERGDHGFDDDGAYFPDDVSAALGAFLVVPERFDFASTARALLATPDLRSVSVWSPVFFLELDAALGTGATWKEIWPDLQVVSCWADAQAAMWTDRVIGRLGDPALFEPKGLLATEGVTSIPVGGRRALAAGIHFHEFIDCATGRVGTEIEPGRRYEVVLTTGAGLYRYRSGDLIEVDGSGSITFLGRRGDQSDLVGEKLDAAQVGAAFRSAGTSGFVRADPSSRRYEIWAAGGGGAVVATLRENPHFARALDTGQLRPCTLCALPAGWPRRAARHLAEVRGARAGDVKLPLLERGELAGLWKR